MPIQVVRKKDKNQACQKSRHLTFTQPRSSKINSQYREVSQNVLIENNDPMAITNELAEINEEHIADVPEVEWVEVNALC